MNNLLFWQKVHKFQEQDGAYFVGLERVGGIEPPSKAWKAPILPLNHTRTN